MTCSANNAERLAWQLGQKLRVRQEKASRCSARQFGQRIRAKPPLSRPQARSRLIAFLVLPDVALEVLLEQPLDDGALGVAGSARGMPPQPEEARRDANAQAQDSPEARSAEQEGASQRRLQHV